MRELFAFFGRERIGVFRETGDGVTFVYEDGYDSTPLSLSLPRDAAAAPGAAAAYLDNLLPDRADVRERWARERELTEPDPMTLLSAYGEDVAGAVSLSPDPDLPSREPEGLFEATEDDIATRIASLTREGTSWTDPRARPRMSLAGAQGKFTLAQIGDRWFWPTYEYPSTHIFKPPAREHRNVDLFESVTLTLARHVGVEAGKSEHVEFLGQPTFVTERWDRTDGVRLHAEDLNQSLGNQTDRKYQVTTAEVARILAPHKMGRRFVRQLAFNVAVGNADAHAKNYSVLLAGDQVVLAPLYDSLPTYFWPRYDASFAMAVGKARHPAELTEKNWVAFALDAGLEPGLVLEEARAVTSAVAENYEAFFGAAGADSTRMRMIQKRVRNLQRRTPTRPAT